MEAVTPVRQLALVGLMGVGKTTVGRLLAQSLRLPLRDSDAEIEAGHGMTVRAIQAREGAEVLHRLEADVLLDQLERPGSSVICAAAATVEDIRCRRSLRGAGVRAIWLRASLETMVARYDSDGHRPRYPEGTRSALRTQLARRASHYAEVAAMTVEVDGLAAHAIAAAIERRALAWGVEPGGEAP